MNGERYWDGDTRENPASRPIKRAIVTGASRGIGKAVSQRLNREGFTVHEFNRVDGNDVRNTSSIEAFMAKIESVDVLINNAAVCIVKPFREFTASEWYDTIDTNLNSIFHFCRLCSPKMIDRGDIINISSRAGAYANPNHVAYAASKAAVMQFSEALALDLKPDGIRVSYLMPGICATEAGGIDPIEDWQTSPDEVADAIIGMIKMPRRTSFGRVEIRPTSRPAYR